MARKRMPKRTVSATVAAKTLGGLIDRVREDRAEYTIERGGTAVARVVPIAASACTLGELAALLTRHKPFDPRYFDEVEKGIRTANKPAVPDDPWTSS